MQRITPQIKDYAWGSRESLAQLAGRPTPSQDPEAELWVGAHEAGPAHLADGRTLDALIADDVRGQLGEQVVSEFGERLPFLLKILAAEKALSIQAHPGAERAAGAPEGTYADSWPKPEAWVPLTECVAFAGSLPFEVVAPRLRELGVPALSELVDAAAGEDRPAHGLLAALLNLPAVDRGAFVTDVMDAVRARVEAGGLDADVAAAWRTSLEVLEQFPGDVGVVVTLTMRHLVMKPGLSYFIDAGVMHSFVRGTTVEILANSDNVVRAGLTPKKIDVDELLEIVDVDAQITPSEPVRDEGVITYESHVPHFSLREISAADEQVDVRVPGEGKPVIVLALGAAATLHGTSSSGAGFEMDDLRLDRLDAAWLPADEGAVDVTLEPGGRLFVASVNR